MSAMYVSGSERAISEAGLSNDALSKPGRWPEISDTKTLRCLTTTSQEVQIATTGPREAGRFGSRRGRSVLAENRERSKT